MEYNMLRQVRSAVSNEELHGLPFSREIAYVVPTLGQFMNDFPQLKLSLDFLDGENPARIILLTDFSEILSFLSPLDISMENSVIRAATATMAF